MSTLSSIRQPQSTFFAGLEEFIARLISVCVTIVFFVIYILAGGNQLTLAWTDALGFLALFWLVYESVAFILFLMFRFFSSSQSSAQQSAQPEQALDTVLDKPSENV